jgi:BolA protein
LPGEELKGQDALKLRNSGVMSAEQADRGISPGPVQGSIELKLNEAFEPAELQVLNESFMHNVPEGSESHFKVVVVSSSMDGQGLLQRHRAIKKILSEEMAGVVHALSIEAYTPSEWQERGGQISPSPVCLGGSKKDLGSES